MTYLIELDALFSLIMIIVYALYSLKAVYGPSTSTGSVSGSYASLYLSDVFFFASLTPLLIVAGYYVEGSQAATAGFASLSDLFDFISLNPIDVLLACLLVVILPSFASFESVLLLLFAFVGSYFMLHSVDLLTFYIALEAQNFCFLVLCGLGSSSASLGSHSPASGGMKSSGKAGLMTGKDSSSFSVEATLKYFLLSAFSSGVILFWFSTIYLQTGLSVLSFKSVMATCYAADDGALDTFYTFQILSAMMFKLGAAPLHLWVVQIYSSVKRSLLMYISTVPKLALFGFWVGSFQGIWTDYSIVLFALFSLVLGSLGAYGQPSLRSLFAYSTVNEIGLMLMAIETAGFHSLFQHLGIYIISQLLLWNMYDKRFFTVLAVSLAGLPPLAGFFGKSWIFWHVSSHNLYTVLIVALFCAGISLVYYLRVLRLFWNSSTGQSTRVIVYNSLTRSYSTRLYSHTGFVGYDTRVALTSLCLVLLVVLPLFLIKPFVL